LNTTAGTTILEYDNPQTIILRNNKPFDPGWKRRCISSEKNAGKEIATCQFRTQ
jgi:hypothetical protein